MGFKLERFSAVKPVLDDQTVEMIEHNYNFAFNQLELEKGKKRDEFNQLSFHKGLLLGYEMTVQNLGYKFVKEEVEDAEQLSTKALQATAH